MSFQSKIKKLKFPISLVILSIFILSVYLYFSFSIPKYFNSPDESLNYYFINKFIETSDLRQEEQLHDISNGIVHPRNSNSINGYIVPNSFIGLHIIAGTIGKLFSPNVIYFIVPFFSVIASILYFFAIKKIFSKKIALLSIFLLLIFPAYWYFSSIPFFHNSLFCSFIIISFYFLINILKNNKNILNYAALGLFLGLSVLTRTSEIIWISLILISIFIICHKKISFTKLILSLLVLSITLFPLFYFNHHLYGNALTVGYISKSTNSSSSLTNLQNNNLSELKKGIFPNGFKIDKLSETISKYLVIIFIPYFLLFIIGIIFVFKKKLFLNNFKRGYFISILFLSIYLIFYYGSGSYFGASGNFNDINISSSIIRYWLPIYIFYIPVISLGLTGLNKKIKNINIRKYFIPVMLIILIIFSINLIYFDDEVGLKKYLDNQELYDNIKSEVLILTSENSIIISSNLDKTIFPERKVIGLSSSLENYSERKNYISGFQNLLDNNIDLYYLTMFGANINDINNKFRIYGIKLRPISTINDTASLYQFVNI